MNLCPRQSKQSLNHCTAREITGEVNDTSVRDVRPWVLVLLHVYGGYRVNNFSPIAVKPSRNVTWESNKDYLKMQVKALL